MFYVKKLLSALMLPPVGPVLVALLGLWLVRRHPRLGRGLTLAALLGMLVLSVPVVADALMQGLEDRPPISSEELKRAQAIVILGGGNYHSAPEYGGDTVGGASLQRVRYGVHLQKQSGLPILVTGGAPYSGRPEGETMKDSIEREFGGKVKWVESASRDTAENASLSARMLKADGVSRIALVSHGWHLKRGIELFERQGLEAVAAPTAFTTQPPELFARLLPSAHAFHRSSEALHEWLGLFVQRLVK